jgi:hypothetical protein
MGLDFISTPRQVENGTLMWHDPETDVKYAIYETGYIRRFFERYNYGYLYSEGATATKWSGYQLNRQRKVNRRNVRELATTPDELLGMLVRAIVSYRKTIARRGY